MKINQVSNYNVNNSMAFGSIKSSVRHLKEKWYGEDYLEYNPHPKSLFKSREEYLDDILSDEPSLASKVKHKWEKFLEEKALNVGGICLVLSTILACGFGLTKSCSKNVSSKNVKTSINLVKENTKNQ